MGNTQTSQARGSRCLDLLGLGLMSIAAFWGAACIQSVRIFLGYSQLYNAPLGNAYFFNLWYHTFKTYNEAMSRSIEVLLVECAGAGVLTFLVLFPFRRRALHRWGAWCCSVVVWLYVLHKSEIFVR